MLQPHQRWLKGPSALLEWFGSLLDLDLPQGPVCWDEQPVAKQVNEVDDVFIELDALDKDLVEPHAAKLTNIRVSTKIRPNGRDRETDARWWGHGQQTSHDLGLAGSTRAADDRYSGLHHSSIYLMADPGS